MGQIKRYQKKTINQKKYHNLEKSPTWILVKYVENLFCSHLAFTSYSAKSNNFFKKK